ncbi:hypothetical protein JCM10207_006319 [Rhodosporidiobolus poonsookiae]
MDPTLDGQESGVKGTEGTAQAGNTATLSSSPAARPSRPTRTKALLSELPPEVILRIFEFVVVDSVLAPATVGKSLSRVSSETRAAGQRLIFRTLSCPRPCIARLSKHLERYPHLAQYIETLSFEPDPRDTVTALEHDHSTMASIVSSCPNLSSLGYPMNVPFDSVHLAFTLAPTLPSSVRTLSVLVTKFHDLPQTFPALDTAVNRLDHFRLICPLHLHAPPTRPRFARSLSPAALSIHFEEQGWPHIVYDTVDNPFTYFRADSVRTLTLELPLITPAVASWLTSATSLASLRLISSTLHMADQLFESLLDLLPDLTTLQHLSFDSSAPRSFARPSSTEITHTRVLAALPPLCTRAEVLAVALQPSTLPPAPRGGRPNCRAVLVLPMPHGLWDVEVGRYMRNGHVEWCEMSRSKVA